MSIFSWIYLNSLNKTPDDKKSNRSVSERASFIDQKIHLMRTRTLVSNTIYNFLTGISVSVINLITYVFLCESVWIVKQIV